LEYAFNFHDEAEYHPITLQIWFHVDMFNSTQDLMFAAEKKIFSYRIDDKQFFDAFRTSTFWNLTSLGTGISKDESWEGELSMQASVLFDNMLYSNTTNLYDITYTFVTPPPNFTHLINVLLVSSFLGVLFGLLILQRKRS
jgi:hypothetical protein